MQEECLVVFSHLRWNFVFQRPQHLLGRLARERDVFFWEEPVFRDGAAPVVEESSPSPGVRVLVPCLPTGSPGGWSEAVSDLVASWAARKKLHDPILWFYTPMAFPLAARFEPRAIVYDCMDELSLFLHAPPDLLRREEDLLASADLVFTGGPSLYRAKKDRHPSVHCFPSSVDAAHFAKARNPGIDAPEQLGMPRPRLGFFGVIDERTDIELVGRMARERPSWHIVLVGPIVKIDPASLPRLANIHYLGQQPYGRLPELLGGWDVCLLPFARNDATRFISPTKTLEYMASEKPIVSKPIRDVADLYSDIVYLGDSPEEFIARADEALSSDAEERERRARAMRSVLAGTSWDRTVEAMGALLRRAAAGKRGASREPKTRAAPRTAVRRARVVIAGAGPTGLSAAYHLGSDALLVEQNDRVGGWCRSIVDRGFTFDHAGHIMFSNDPYVHELYALLLGDNVHWQDREAWIFSKGVYTRYPFQGSLHGLPAEVVKECLVGALEARFGPLGAGSNGNGVGKSCSGVHTNGNGKGRDATKVDDCCADGLLESTAPLAGATGPPRNFEEFIYKVWGRGIAKHFAIPYNRKLWAVPLTEMETSWLGGRVPMPDIEEMIEGALRPSPGPMGPNARFGYPLRGGFQALMDGFLPHLRGEVLLGTRIVGVSPSIRRVELSDGTHAIYDRLISTMPLPVLVKLIGSEAPPEVKEAASRLRFVSVRCVNLGVAREKITDKHWIYYPEDTVFHRIFVQGNASPFCNPPGGFGFTCEITYSKTKPLPRDGEELIDLVIEDCRRIGFIERDDEIICRNSVDLPHAYVVYDHARADRVALVRRWLEARGIFLAGRYSEWEYYNSDHAFLAGKKAAERVTASHVAPTRLLEAPLRATRGAALRG